MVTYMNITALQQELRNFSAERGWGRNHNPKSLVMALSVEVGELMEHFQWLTEQESYQPSDREGVQEELADVMIYLLQLSDRLEIDVTQAVMQKIYLNSMKYPVSQDLACLGQREGTD